MTVKKRLWASAAIVLLGAGMSAAAPSAASASAGSCSGAPLQLYYSGTPGNFKEADFGCGTTWGNWWGFDHFYSGGHGYGAVQLNHNGTYYNLSVNYTGQWQSSKYGTSDDAVEVWIGS